MSFLLMFHFLKYFHLNWMSHHLMYLLNYLYCFRLNHLSSLLG